VDNFQDKWSTLTPGIANWFAKPLGFVETTSESHGMADCSRLLVVEDCPHALSACLADRLTCSRWDAWNTVHQWLQLCDRAENQGWAVSPAQILVKCLSPLALVLDPCILGSEYDSRSCVVADAAQFSSRYLDKTRELWRWPQMQQFVARCNAQSSYARCTLVEALAFLSAMEPPKITCPHCRQLYSQASGRVPLITLCGHRVCLSCHRSARKCGHVGCDGAITRNLTVDDDLLDEAQSCVVCPPPDPSVTDTSPVLRCCHTLLSPTDVLLPDRLSALIKECNNVLASLQTTVCNAVTAVCTAHEANRVLASRCDGMALLTEVLRPGPQSSDASVAAWCGAVKALCGGAAATTRSDTNIARFASGNAFDVLVFHLQRFGTCVPVCVQGIGALWMLARWDGIKPRMVASGAVSLVLSLMDAHIQQPDVMVNSCGFLKTLASHAEMQNRVIGLGGLPRVYACVDCHPNNGDVLEQALLTLRNLAYFDSNKTALTATGVLARLSRVMTVNTCDSLAFRECCGVVYNLCVNCPANAAAVVASGVLHKLVDVLVCSDSEGPTAEPVCSALFQVAQSTHAAAAMSGQLDAVKSTLIKLQHSAKISASAAQWAADLLALLSGES
jgi:hypothetical protein